MNKRNDYPYSARLGNTVSPHSYHAQIKRLMRYHLAFTSKELYILMHADTKEERHAISRTLNNMVRDKHAVRLDRGTFRLRGVV